MGNAVAQQAADTAAAMSAETVRLLNDMKLSQAQADALSPLIRNAVADTHSMLKRQFLSTGGFPVERILVTKSKAIFNRADDDARTILSEGQWPAWLAFKTFAAREICRASYDVVLRPEGNSVRLEVKPE
ncbi:MAG: hypothetical protein HC809_03075 [Gammaproteobacteria bacterium]|nr:hypothetical protein [Gammaproteobacteria bacterium]